MRNKITHFLTISIVLVSFFCVMVFGIQTACMNLIGEDAVKRMGVIYMSGLSEQVAAHFGTTIELRLSQVEALADVVPPGRFASGTALRTALAESARSRGFGYLAFYTEDGDFQMIHGPQVTADDPKILQRSVLDGRYNVCAGKDEEGTQVVLMGVPAAYPLPGGQTSAALVAGLPASYFRDTLTYETKTAMVEYAILSDDGSYILQNDAVEESNYFERIEKRYEPLDGKEPAQYAREFRDAMEAGRDHTSTVMISGVQWNVYCTDLPDSEWHLLLKISHNPLDETVELLRARWTFVSVSGCLLVIGALLLVFLGYFRLTRRQMYELDEAKISAERASRAKNEFLSNMSHDIRTPMNGIMGMTSVAINNLQDPPRVLTCLKRINVSSRHLLGLINDMLDMSKIETGRLQLHMEPVSLRDVMQNVMTIMQPQILEKEQHFNIYIYDISSENICTDRVRFSQILLNILGNCVKFTPMGGDIRMELREEPSPKGNAYVRICLYIKDNGIGMSREFQSRIFEAFAREDSSRVDREAGAGMGMTITKYIVDAMGGTIAVQSEQGRGTDFHITLDMEKAVQNEPELCLPERDVLVVDDDRTACGIACTSLQSLGLRAECASDAKKAFEIVAARHESGAGYPVILLDWDLVGYNGIQTARDMRRRFGAQIPIVLMSDGEWDELETAAEKVGINGFVSKPLFRSVLYYGLRRFVEGDMDTRASGEDPEIELKGRHILVAEDNELNWEIADAILSELGMELDWAENGQICVEKFSQSSPGYYDAVLMDLRMPVMTGYGAASAIRALDREDARIIPIIAVSADSFEEDVQKCFDCGMDAHTAKPFNTDQVVGLLEQLIAERAKKSQ